MAISVGNGSFLIQSRSMALRLPCLEVEGKYHKYDGDDHNSGACVDAVMNYVAVAVHPAFSVWLSAVHARCNGQYDRCQSVDDPTA